MRIGAVLCARDEAHIIEEWIAHHLALGIGRIHIFDHGSTDGTRAIVDAVARVVPGVTVETWEATGNVQQLAFDRGLKRMTAEGVDWCAFIDADEFIANGAAASSDRLEDMLLRHSTHCAIGMHWAIFGSAGHIARPAGLIQENFLYRAHGSFGPNRHIKSIVRPRYTMGAHNCHGFSLDHPYYTAGGEKIAWHLPFAFTTNTPDMMGWRLNHYFCQWRDRWDAKLARSRVRGRESVVRSERDWTHHDRNEVFDPSALRWIPQVKAKLEELRAAPPAV